MLRPEAMTWSGLLARWIEFAQASLALPRDATGDAWRASVPHIINLQAVTFALGDVGSLSPADRPVALDKAEVLIDSSEKALLSHWVAGDLPPLLAEVIADSRVALGAAARIAIDEIPDS